MSKTSDTPATRTLPPNFVATYAALIPFVMLFFPDILALANQVDTAGQRHGNDAASPHGNEDERQRHRSDHES